MLKSLAEINFDVWKQGSLQLLVVCGLCVFPPSWPWMGLFGLSLLGGDEKGVEGSLMPKTSA